MILVDAIAIVGTGNVGSCIASLIVSKEICNKLYLVSSTDNTTSVEGVLCDLMGNSSDIDIAVAGYKEVQNVDLVIVCSGIAQKEKQSRNDLLDENKKIVKKIGDELKKIKYNKRVIVVTNPVDISSYLLQRQSQINCKKIIGVGTLIDQNRLRNICKKNIDIGEAKIVGEHGDSMVLIRASKKKFSRVFGKVKNLVYEIIDKKKVSNLGIGFTVIELIEKLFSPCVCCAVPFSCYDYEHGIYISNLYDIGNNKIEKVSHVLSKQEQRSFDLSVDAIKKQIEECD
jgi:malate/lactate dehydrogenase